MDGRGVVRTLAWNGRNGFAGEGGKATAAEINFVHGAAQLTDGSFVLADMLNNRIRGVAPDGTITTVAGSTHYGYSGDGGPATQARINTPRGLAAMPDGGFVIADSNNHRVRRVLPDGRIITVAGNGAPGFAGDGGPATLAQLSTPFGVAPTADGGVLIADVGSHRIRKVDAAGSISTVAGNGTGGYSGDGGRATAASLYNPHNVAALGDGGFVIADTSNHRLRRVWPDGTITTIAGTGAEGFAGDGNLASRAQLRHPKGVAVLPSGAILVADEQNDRIRYIGVPRRPVNVTRPSIVGRPAVGRTLRAVPGSWTGYGVRLAYVWERCGSTASSCKRIARANGTTLVVQRGDRGRRFRVSVKASTLTLAATAKSRLTARAPG